ncbi:peptidase domain-containing ABC transporter [Xylanimonas allomyrinae]|uniref:Peptidase domain-containing ABC transporter n=1 Tax=Xylanimonas allomyrinae TaxID=2509459 RepID=A0A4P6EJ63_9MICO|nr:peptidase domain-containing ABC transporter [Xylanimonas allomyrinae]QAY62572.1 peptidase domain-containing ABC transporter [Xylanimonas allomyrinae]
MRRRAVHLVRQGADTECALACCAMVLHAAGSGTRMADLRRRYEPGRDGLNVKHITTVLRDHGCEPHVYRTTAAGLATVPLPAICYWDRRHYVVVTRVDSRGATLYDPGTGRARISHAQLDVHFSGLAVTSEPASRRTPSTVPSPARVLARLARPHAGVLLGALGAALVSALAVIGLPSVLGAVLDGSPSDGWGATASVLLGIAVMYALLLVARSSVSILASVVLGRSLAEQVFHRLVRLPYSYFVNRGTGAVLFDLDAVQQLRVLLTTDVIGVAVGVIVSAALLGWIGTQSVTALAAMGAVIIVLVLLTVVSSRAVRATAVDETARRAELQGVQVTAVSGIEAIKTNGAEERYVRTWRSLNNRVQRAFARLQGVQAAFTALTAGLQLVAPILIVVIVSSQREADVATVVAVQALSGFLLGQVAAVAGSLTAVAEGWAMLDRVAAVLVHPVDDRFQGDPGSAPTSTEIAVRAASFAYATFSTPVVRCVTLDVPAGSMVALVGPSGSGKSTLGRLIVGLHRPTEGSVAVGGNDLAHYDRDAYYAHVAYVPQSVVLDHGTLRDNLLRGVGDVSDDAIAKALECVGLAHDVAGMPLGLETPVAPLGQNLSGGQRQRVALARAALKRASVIVLDEATSSLDHEAESTVTEYFRGLNATRVVIAHRLSTIIDADLICVMDEGRIVERGTHAELVARRGRYWELYSSRTSAAAGLIPV